MMRTTLNIDDDIMAIVRSLSKDREQSVGRVVSDLLRKALRPSKALSVAGDDDLPAFHVSDHAPIISKNRASELLDDED